MYGFRKGIDPLNEVALNKTYSLAVFNRRKPFVNLEAENVSGCFSAADVSFCQYIVTSFISSMMNAALSNDLLTYMQMYFRILQRCSIQHYCNIDLKCVRQCDVLWNHKVIGKIDFTDVKPTSAVDHLQYLG